VVLVVDPLLVVVVLVDYFTVLVTLLAQHNQFKLVGVLLETLGQMLHRVVQELHHSLDQ